MSFLERLHDRAAALDRRVAFAESSDDRVRAAAVALAERGIARPVMVCDDQDTDSILFAERAGLAVSRADDRLDCAISLVKNGEADACVVGAVYTTAEVLRAALRIVGPAPGATTVSSAFYMVRTTPWEAPADVLTFTDCAVVPEPTAEQLAEIAIAAAADRRKIVGDVPRVAFLSYSTRGSAAGESVTRVRRAVELARERDPGLAVDGELQGDAALIPAVAQRKARGGTVAGAANILVFPSLDAGNIAYKLVERLAAAQAIGPILQGLALPVADLSRGAGVHDIINVAAVAVLQSVPAHAISPGDATR